VIGYSCDRTAAGYLCGLVSYISLVPKLLSFSGGSPYPRVEGRKIANWLQEGYRMPKPQHVHDKL